MTILEVLCSTEFDAALKSEVHKFILQYIGVKNKLDAGERLKRFAFDALKEKGFFKRPNEGIIKPMLVDTIEADIDKIIAEYLDIISKRSKLPVRERDFIYALCTPAWQKAIQQLNKQENEDNKISKEGQQ